MKHQQIPYFQTTRIRVESMVKLSEPVLNQKVADLGTGDGRLAIAFAQKGAHVTAFEINDELIKLARTNIENSGLEHRISVIKQDFWKIDMGEFDIVAVYPFPDIMDELEKKLLSELKPGARVVTNFYPFPNWEPEEKRENVYVYKK